MRKSTAKYENYPVRRTGFFVWAALIFVWGVPASAQEPVRMQVKDSCGVQTEPYEAATYPGGIVAFSKRVNGRSAGSRGPNRPVLRFRIAPNSYGNDSIR